jgi:hypothetical protein
MQNGSVNGKSFSLFPYNYGRVVPRRLETMFENALLLENPATARKLLVDKACSITPGKW